MLIIYPIIILCSWYIEMPLWLSITSTVLSALGIIFRILYLGVKWADKANNID